MSTHTENNSIPRPPVVVVMGHIDHGKSTLLDYIRSTNNTQKEAGGITQHLGAYEVEPTISGEPRKITFLDTPGHAAFSSIRTRGASVADIAVLVVSAEDGVKPQTIEALKSINETGIPFIVAINKIDKPGSNVDKVKQSLAEHEVLVEGWGGTIPVVPISAKTGENIADLLEMIVLQADVSGLLTNSHIPAEGYVIESGLDPRRGISATLIIKNGTLERGNYIASGEALTPIRTLENFLGESIERATSSSPVRIAGWDKVPAVGSTFHVFADKQRALDYIENEKRAQVESAHGDTTDERAKLPLIVKADTFGTLEAVVQELSKMNNEKIAIKVVSKGIGLITEGDVKTALSGGHMIVGFHVRVDKNAAALALREKIDVRVFDIIYELTDFVHQRLREATPTEMVEHLTGKAKILKTFSKQKDRQVVGGRVETGEIKTGSGVRIVRRDTAIGEGKVKELQSQKIKIGSVAEGQEFGITIESKIDIVPGDVIEAIALIKQ